MLGDGNLTHAIGKANSALRIGQTLKHEDYVKFKYEILKEFCSQAPKVLKNGGYGKFMVRFATRSIPLMTQYYNLCYKQGKKTITKEWLDQITAEGLAVWYMDDGGLVGKTMRISTHGKTYPEQELLVEMLRRFNVEAQIKFEARKNLWYLQFSAENRNKFMEIITPHIIPCMEYKLYRSDLLENRKCVVCQKEFLVKLNLQKQKCCSRKCYDKQPHIMKYHREHNQKTKSWRNSTRSKLRRKPVQLELNLVE